MRAWNGKSLRLFVSKVIGTIALRTVLAERANRPWFNPELLRCLDKADPACVWRSGWIYCSGGFSPVLHAIDDA